MLLLKYLWNVTKRYLVVIKLIIYTSMNYLFEVNSKQGMKMMTEMTNRAINTAKSIHSDLTFPIILQN